MSSDSVICNFCGRECKSEEDVGFLVFSDGKKKAAHLHHPGVREEYEKQSIIANCQTPDHPKTDSKDYSGWCESVKKESRISKNAND